MHFPFENVPVVWRFAPKDGVRWMLQNTANEMTQNRSRWRAETVGDGTPTLSGCRDPLDLRTMGNHNGKPQRKEEATASPGAAHLPAGGGRTSPSQTRPSQPQNHRVSPSVAEREGRGSEITCFSHRALPRVGGHGLQVPAGAPPRTWTPARCTGPGAQRPRSGTCAAPPVGPGLGCERSAGLPRALAGLFGVGLLRE